jgi:hypothetical protein
MCRLYFVWDIDTRWGFTATSYNIYVLWIYSCYIRFNIRFEWGGKWLFMLKIFFTIAMIVVDTILFINIEPNNGSLTVAIMFLSFGFIVIVLALIAITFEGALDHYL